MQREAGQKARGLGVNTTHLRGRRALQLPQRDPGGAAAAGPALLARVGQQELPQQEGDHRRAQQQRCRGQMEAPGAR